MLTFSLSLNHGCPKGIWPIELRLRYPGTNYLNNREITLPGYKLFEQQRVGKKGGGIALLWNETIDAQKVNSGECRSFEFGEWIFKYGSSKLRVIVIYCPPYSAAQPVTSSMFLDKFPVYLESIVMSPEPLLITGDFNIHVNISSDPDAARFLELLTLMGLEQHIDKPTHISGHTLDLIITQCLDSLLCVKPLTDYLISDHFTVLCDLQLGKPALKVNKCPTSVSRHQSYSRLLGISFHTHTITLKTRKSTSASSLTVARPSAHSI